jgi:hypothetical protein
LGSKTKEEIMDVGGTSDLVRTRYNPKIIRRLLIKRFWAKAKAQ